MWMKKAEFGLGNKTIVGLCSNSLRNTNPRGRVGNPLPRSHSVEMQQNWLVGLTEAPMKLATSRLG